MIYTGGNVSDYIKRLRLEMIKVYGKNCWMDENWVWQRNNLLTLHHIHELRNGGKTCWVNSALLSRKSHIYLNYLDREYYKIYKELNGAFRELNKTYAPPTQEYYGEINEILRKAKRKC